MKIINLITNNIFDIPAKEAEKILNDAPNEFAKLSKNKKITKKNSVKEKADTFILQILDE